MNHSAPSSAIAIVGMSGRFPGARNLAEFWNNLRNGVESISFVSAQDLTAAGVDPELIKDRNFVNAAGILDDVEMFDASFFGFNAREAETLDPQQRLLLECAWHTLEDSGYDPETYEGSIAVYAGAALSTYLFNVLSHPEHRALVGDFLVFTGNDKDHLTTRISYKLNLKGPSMAVQTACSTSLVAVATACQSLLDHQCDMALAGGVSVRVPQNSGYLYQEGMILSRDGHSRTFDANATGTIFSNGLGLVALKRLSDAIDDGDNIHAVINGWAINNDGSLKVGYAAPGLDAQAEVTAIAHAMAEVDPRSITYVEAHGTATPMGDPIEVAALTKAFRAATDQKNFCAIGSVKPNLGHLDAAAGIAGLIKTVLSLKHKLVPPSVNFEHPNPAIDFANSPFYVNTKISEWKSGDTPRRAGVHSFGIGGTNAHVVLEEAPLAETTVSSRPLHLLVLSARTRTALQAQTASLADFFKQNAGANLADAAYTCHVGRREFAHRRSLVCTDASDAASLLTSIDSPRVLTATKAPGERSVVFMFPGQGSHYVNMALDLYRTEPTFRYNVDQCSELLKPRLGFDLRQILYPSLEKPASLNSEGPAIGDRAIDSYAAQPALFVVEYALAKLWMDWGIRPQMMIGHSLGEYVAACLSGVLSLPDALLLMAEQCRLMRNLPSGAMLVVPLSKNDINPFMSPDLEIAAINGPAMCIVSGPVDAIVNLEAELAKAKVEHRRINTAHAFHSRLMEPMLGEFTAVASSIKRQPPQIPYVSNATGTWISPDAATDPAYWGQQLRQTVRFADGLATLLKVPNRILLEVGPGRDLAGLAQRHPAKTGEHIIISSLARHDEHVSDTGSMLRALGRLWLAGMKIDWKGFWRHEKRRRVSVPGYAFDRKRYWIEMRQASPAVSAAANRPSMQAACANSGNGSQKPAPTTSTAPPNNSMGESYVAPSNEIERGVAEIWQKLLGVQPIGIYDDFFQLGGHSMLAAQLLALMRSAFHVELPLPTLFEVPTVAGMAERIKAIQ